MRKILIILVLAAVIVFGYYAYKSLKSSTGGNVSAGGIKSLIENKANDVNSQINETTDQTIQDAKNQAAGMINNKVNQALGATPQN